MSIQRDGNKNRLMFLIDRLDRIQCATCPVILERSMHEFTHELLQLKTRRTQGASPQFAGIFLQCDETILVSDTKQEFGAETDTISFI